MQSLSRDYDIQDVQQVVGSNGHRAEESRSCTYPAMVRLLPLAFFFTFLNATVLIFFFGPWSYPIINGVKLMLFLAAAHCALGLGYWSCAFKSPRPFNQPWRIEILACVSVAVSLAVLFPTIEYRTGTFFPSVIAAFSNPGMAYANSFAARSHGNSLIEYVRTIVGPLLAMCLPLTIFYWKRLSPLVRLGGILNLVGVFVMFIAMGTNKAIGDALFLEAWMLVAAHFSGRLTSTVRQRVILGALVVLQIAFFLLFFTRTQHTRTGAPARSGQVQRHTITANRHHVMVRYLPEEGQVGVLGLTEYVAHGYYALYLALDQPFVPAFGVGNSLFLSRQAARLLRAPSVMDRSYPARVQASSGWSSTGLWSTIYPWIASDVSFPGTIIVVFMIGRLLALTWLDTLRGDNPFAVAMFAQTTLMLIYFSATNACLQDGEGVTSFFLILGAWLWTRRNRVSLQ